MPEETDALTGIGSSYGSTREEESDNDEENPCTSTSVNPPVPVPVSVNPPVNLNTRFAADRTYMAADRTAFAWVRTAISMIGFGVTIAKAADVLQSDDLIQDSQHVKVFGLVFVGVAWLGLVLVIIQNVNMERRLAASGYGREESIPLGLSMAVLVLLVGILGAIIIFHPVK